MKKLLSLSAIAFSLSMGLTGLAQAQSAAPASAPAKAASAPAKAASAPAASAPAAAVKTAQQSKMGTCNGEAQGKKGDERKSFMKECLSK